MAVRLTTPVTILTGFLGSGKTTLVNRILQENHDARIAVIENEFGQVGVDAEFLSRNDKQTIIQLANGCLCCAIRGDLARALHQLAQQAQQREVSFDRVLIETTGLADPAPIIQTFLAETAIESLFHLDGVVAVVDAAHARVEAERPEFRSQLGYADRLIVSKSDLVTDAERQTLQGELSSTNPRAPVVAADLHRSDIRELMSHVFDVRGFSNDHIPSEEINRILRRNDPDLRLRPTLIGKHTRGVTSRVFDCDAPLDLDRLNKTLDALVALYGPKLWRCKGIVHSAGHRSRLVVQGVQGAIQIGGGTVWRPFEPRRTVLIFIGLELEAATIQTYLDNCKVTSQLVRPI
jgi:G3E family GTPase